MPLSLLDALDSEELFGSVFPKPSWNAWRGFCAALYGLPMPPAQLNAFRASTGRSRAPTTPASEAWVIAGRRSGKSRIASAIATYIAALAPTTTLAAGEVGTVLVCAVSREQAKVVFNYCRALFDLPALRPLVSGETSESIELRHHVRLEVRASNFRAVRGVTLLAAVLDEMAFLREEGSALPDVELYRALKPALATTGGLILGISSPWAQRGLLWSKYKKHFAQDGDVLVWQANSLTMNPTLRESLVLEAMADDPEAAAAEWEGQFRSDLESYVSTQVLDACTVPGVVERPPLGGVAYQAFLDPASGSGRDSFTAAVGHAEPTGDGQVVAVVDACRSVSPPFDPLSVAGEVAAFLKTYGVQVAQCDRYAGAFVVQAFQRHGIVVTQDAPPKSELYLGALPLLNAGRVELLDLPQLRAQFSSLERRRRAGGRDIVDHPPGNAHDDLANAVAGLVVRVGAGEAAIGVDHDPPPEWSLRRQLRLGVHQGDLEEAEGTLTVHAHDGLEAFWPLPRP
jgi:hypothetical protein